MSVLSLSCAIALQCSGPSPSLGTIWPPSPQSFAAALSDSELADVYGMGLPVTGQDQESQAGRARSVDIAFAAERTSDRTRDLFDNWNVQVATPLIAQATIDARR